MKAHVERPEKRRAHGPSRRAPIQSWIMTRLVARAFQTPRQWIRCEEAARALRISWDDLVVNLDLLFRRGLVDCRQMNGQLAYRLHFEGI